MDSLHIFNSSWAVVALTGLLASSIAVAVMMGLFSKNQLPVEGRVRNDAHTLATLF
jgi:hypothetical protein